MKIVSPASLLLLFILTLSFLTACQRDLDNRTAENKPPLVSAGKDTIFQLASLQNDTIRLTGTATDADGTINGYAWTQVSGPNTTKIHTPATAATEVSGVAEGQYSFQLTATDDKGATGKASVSITVKGPQVITAIFQPHQSNLEMHLAVVGSDNISDDKAPELNAVAWTMGGIPSYMRGLLKFDWSSIPAGAKVVAAKLTLYSNPKPIAGNGTDANSGANNSIVLERVKTDWNTQVTWKTQPQADATTQVLIPHTNEEKLDLVDVDVTNLVKDMRQFGNYGFLIRLKSESIYTSRIFCSSKFSDATKHPKLVIQYTN